MSNITFSDIRIRPFCHCDPEDYEYPAFELFDERHDFIHNYNYCKIGVYLRAENSEYGLPDVTTRAWRYTVSLIDDNDQVKKSTDFSVTLAPWMSSQEIRVDLYTFMVLLDPDRTYRVAVSPKGSKKVLIEAPMRLFVVPVPYRDVFKPSCAYVDLDDIKYRNIFVEDSVASVNFELECRTDQLLNLPEAMIVIYDSNGNKNTKRATFSTEGELSEPFTLVKASANLYLNQYYDGVVYAELQIFGMHAFGMLFTTDEDMETGVYSSDELVVINGYTVDTGLKLINERKEAKRPAFKDTFAKLDSMVGLDDVKEKVCDYAKLVKFNQQRAKLGLQSSLPALHAMFLGSSGTGKTTVAKIMGELLYSAGVLSKGHVVVRERATLLGQNYSSESENTLAAIKEAEGGILFIDEAYQLYQPHDRKDPGRFVIETLLTALADESKKDWMLILAGYTKPMLQMFNLNPGLSSRIPQTNIYHFEDFTPTQLHDIAVSYLTVNNFHLSPEAEAQLNAVIDCDYANRTESFGNARHVLKFIQNGIFPAMARRLDCIDEPNAEELSLVLPCDIPAPTQFITNKRQRVGFASR